VATFMFLAAYTPEASALLITHEAGRGPEEAAGLRTWTAKSADHSFPTCVSRCEHLMCWLHQPRICAVD